MTLNIWTKTTLLFLAICAFPDITSAKTNDLSISVAPSSTIGYKITITFYGDTDGTTVLVLPKEWGGQRELYKAIHNLTVRPAGTKLHDTNDPHLKTVSHMPGQKITIEYDLVQDFEGPLRNSIRYRPVADDEHIHWIGHTVWVLPDRDDSQKLSANVDMSSLSRQWTVGNSFGIKQRRQKIRASLGDLRKSIWVAGDFRIASTKVAGKAVNVVLRGEWKFSDADLSEMVRKVVLVERDFWDDYSQDYYLVSLVPIDEGPDASSIGGTGLHDSFALFATPNATPEQFQVILAHEYAHNWIPEKLGRMPEQEEQLYWFSEGFTEFYTIELLHRGKLISSEERATAYNDRIAEYYRLSVRTEPNTRIIEDFWNSPDVQRLPYIRGFLFAANLNSAIKKGSNGQRSLDDLMREMHRTSKVAAQQLSFDRLNSIFTRYLGHDSSPAVTRHLVNGELISPDPDLLGSAYRMETELFPVFELGFDFDRLAKERTVAGVDPSSAAYAAGLRDGQRLIGGISISFGNTKKEVAINVQDAAENKTIRFLPVARQEIQVPQFRYYGAKVPARR